jgi:hypothetical protein
MDENESAGIFQEVQRLPHIHEHEDFQEKTLERGYKQKDQTESVSR